MNTEQYKTYKRLIKAAENAAIDLVEQHLLSESDIREIIRELSLLENEIEVDFLEDE